MKLLHLFGVIGIAILLGATESTQAMEGPPPGDRRPSLLERLFRDADADTNGEVTLTEFLNWVPDGTEDRFDRLDRNDDGVLTEDDIPEREHDDPVHRLLSLLRTADANNDGEVTYEEVLGVDPDFPEKRFDVLDQNDDGVISQDDLPFGHGPFDKFIKLLREADEDENGEVTFDELLAVMPDLTEDQFDRLDRNDDDVITKEDFPHPPPENIWARLLRLLREADDDGNGEVTFAEITAIQPDFPEELFDRLDKNDDDVISKDDLPDGPFPGPAEMLLRLLHAADADCDCQVTFDELLAVVPELSEERFDHLDKNDDDVLSYADLPHFNPDPVDRLKHLLRTADMNEDGEVTFDELLEVLPELTEERFDHLDTNGDEVITADDLPDPPKDPLQRLIRHLHEADVDENGEVTFDELAAIFPDLSEELFDRLDKNDDDVITKEDLPKRPIDIRRWFCRLMQEADADDNGEVTFEELVAVHPDITQERFDQMDHNDDGVINKEDIPKDPRPNDDEGRRRLLRTLLRADLNHDGMLEFAEIAEVYPDAPAELLDALDANDDEVITRDEILDALGRNPDGDDIVDEEDVDGSGDTNIIDVQALVTLILELGSPVLPADYNNNGRTDITDLQKVVDGVLNSF